ncbi:hypothetical protein F4861DRAFT_89800 [Xylaria intraflava]|nr:hypothetical protein F4861DRAFT_89800 [Xylaria intraflava]
MCPFVRGAKRLAFDRFISLFFIVVGMGRSVADPAGLRERYFRYTLWGSLGDGRRSVARTCSVLRDIILAGAIWRILRRMRPVHLEQGCSFLPFAERGSTRVFLVYLTPPLAPEYGNSIHEWDSIEHNETKKSERRRSQSRWQTASNPRSVNRDIFDIPDWGFCETDSGTVHLVVSSKGRNTLSVENEDTSLTR